MKAVVFHEFGGLDVLRVEELPDPAPGRGQVLIDIRRARSTISTSTSARASLASRSSCRSCSASRSSGDRRARGRRRGLAGRRPGHAATDGHCGDCRYCRTGRESLCLAAGLHQLLDLGGYAEQLACSRDS